MSGALRWHCLLGYGISLGCPVVCLVILDISSAPDVIVAPFVIIVISVLPGVVIPSSALYKARRFMNSSCQRHSDHGSFLHFLHWVSWQYRFGQMPQQSGQTVFPHPISPPLVHWRNVGVSTPYGKTAVIWKRRSRAACRDSGLSLWVCMALAAALYAQQARPQTAQHLSVQVVQRRLRDFQALAVCGWRGRAPSGL